MALHISPQITTLAGAQRSLIAQGATSWNLPALVNLLVRNIMSNPAIRYKSQCAQNVYIEALNQVAGLSEEPSTTKIYARVASGLMPDGTIPPRTKQEESRAFTKGLVDQLEKSITKAIAKSQQRKTKVVTKGHGKSVKILARLASGLPAEE